jgi:hypothetical protein
MEKPCEGVKEKETIVTYRLKDKIQKKIKTIWAMEINTLEELLEFQKKCNQPIIIEESDNFDLKEIYELEIYDDYRE